MQWWLKGTQRLYLVLSVDEERRNLVMKGETEEGRRESVEQSNESWRVGKG